MEKFRRHFDRYFQYYSLLPAALVLVLLTIYPVGQLLRMSVSEISFVGQQQVWEYVGNKHVQTAAQDPVVPWAVRNTMVFVVVVTVIEVVLGLLLAVGVSRSKKGSAAYRTLILMPLLLPPIAIGTMWRLMYDYNYGLVNQVLALAGIDGPIWLANPDIALACIMLVDVWHWTSFVFLILLAGFESLPHELAEQGYVDGATENQVFRHIFLPLMIPTIGAAAMLRTIFAFKVFDQIFLLTGGGPGIATEVMNLYIYKVFFEQFRLGYGAFLAIAMAVVISIFVAAYRTFGRGGTT